MNQQMKEIIEQDGPWSAHNIHLGEGLYTIGRRDTRDDVVVQRVVQTVADIMQRPLQTLRILDLACLEGVFGIEFARHGASVVGIEAREASLRKANFASQTLGLSNIKFVQDDVRNLSRDKYGEFDVVLCLGILYHLETPDAFDLIHRVSSVCRDLAIVHTHFSTGAKVHVEFQGRKYAGRRFLEHLPGASEQQKRQAVWGSLDNPQSFWMTRASLFNVLQDAGFTSVMECRIPYLPNQPDDHVTLAAIKGAKQEILSVPDLGTSAQERWPEHATTRVHPGQKWYYPYARRFGARLPGKQMIKKLLRLEWHGDPKLRAGGSPKR